MSSPPAAPYAPGSTISMEAVKAVCNELAEARLLLAEANHRITVLAQENAQLLQENARLKAPPTPTPLAAAIARHREQGADDPPAGAAVPNAPKPPRGPRTAVAKAERVSETPDRSAPAAVAQEA